MNVCVVCSLFGCFLYFFAKISCKIARKDVNGKMKNEKLAIAIESIEGKFLLKKKTPTTTK